MHCYTTARVNLVNLDENWFGESRLVCRVGCINNYFVSRSALVKFYHDWHFFIYHSVGTIVELSDFNVIDFLGLAANENIHHKRDFRLALLNLVLKNALLFKVLECLDSLHLLVEIAVKNF